ncbi:MAG: phytanoyl-CoA dioxygenase family protein [Patescibacteria group bacterium]
MIKFAVRDDYKSSQLLLIFHKVLIVKKSLTIIIQKCIRLTLVDKNDIASNSLSPYSRPSKKGMKGVQNHISELEFDPRIQQMIEEPSFYPTDNEGYAISFDPFSESDMVVDSFNSFGFAVISQVISPSVVHYSLDRIHQWKTQFSDPDPNGNLFVSNGFMELYHDRFISEIRSSYRYYSAHTLIWKTSRLWVTFDRISIKQLDDPASYSHFLHTNQNPFKHQKLSYSQGFISLQEEPEINGNIRIVPNSHRYFNLWKSFTNSDSLLINLELDQNPYLELLKNNSLTLSIKPGDGLIWDARLVHSSTPNQSKNPRISVLSSFMPAIMQDSIREKRLNSYEQGFHLPNRSARLNSSTIPRYLNLVKMNDFRETELLDRFGRLLYGLESY